MRRTALEIEAVFRKNANPDLAVGMSKYMRDKFPFLGIKTPERRNLQAIWLREIAKEQPSKKWQLVFQLWELEEREFQYAALDVLKKIPAKELQMEDIQQLKRLIISKAWWDTVDLIASNILGKWMKKFPELREEILHDWSSDENLWLRRSCLIFQLKYKQEMDLNLLFSLIEQLKGDKDFFIQKAIGWSLRQASRLFPDEVRQFLSENPQSRLATSEGSKYL